MTNDWKDWTPEMVDAHNAKVRGLARNPTPLPNSPPEPTLPESKGKGRRRVPNKTEAAYMNVLAMEFHGAVIRYEPITFHMANGHSYTPDIGVWHSVIDQGVMFVEVKNAAYKHASYGRAKLAFDQCRQEFGAFCYRWAELTKDGWTVCDY